LLNLPLSRSPKQSREPEVTTHSARTLGLRTGAPAGCRSTGRKATARHLTEHQMVVPTAIGLLRLQPTRRSFTATAAPLPRAFHAAHGHLRMPYDHGVDRRNLYKWLHPIARAPVGVAVNASQQAPALPDCHRGRVWRHLPFPAGTGVNSAGCDGGPCSA